MLVPFRLVTLVADREAWVRRSCWTQDQNQTIHGGQEGAKGGTSMSRGCVVAGRHGTAQWSPFRWLIFQILSSRRLILYLRGSRISDFIPQMLFWACNPELCAALPSSAGNQGLCSGLCASRVPTGPSSNWRTYRVKVGVPTHTLSLECPCPRSPIPFQACLLFYLGSPLRVDPTAGVGS